MASYVVPQVEIHQLFSEIPAALQRNQVAFVFGPNYLIHRYSDQVEQPKLFLGSYDKYDNSVNSTGFYEYPAAVLDAEKIDTKYTKMFAKNAFVYVGIDGASVQIFSISPYISSADSLSSDSPSAVTTDKIVIHINSSIFDIIPRGNIFEAFLKDIKGLYIGTNSPSSSRSKTSRVANDVYDSYDKVVRVTNILEPDYDAFTVAVEIDEEITFDGEEQSIDIDILDKNDDIQIDRWSNVITLNWTESKEGSKLGVKLVNGEIFAVPEHIPNLISEISRISAAMNEVPVPPAELLAKNAMLPVVAADLYLECRELSTAAADTIHSINYATEVANALGDVTPDNPLAQAVYNAALNSGGQLVRYMALPSDDEDGWNAVLNAASLTKEVYFMVPVTRDEGILELVQSHVKAMSKPHTKRWRVAFVSAEIPEIDPIYTAAASTDGSDFKCKLDNFDADAMTVDATFYSDDSTPSKDTKFKKDVKVDDYLYTAESTEYGIKSLHKFKIVKVISNNTIKVKFTAADLYLDRIPSISSGYPTGLMKAEIYHPYTNAEKAEVIKNLSSSFADRRMYNVFPSEFVTDGVIQSGEFAAACVAGLVSSCLPQQPVTNLELVGINDIPLVYQTFSFDQLNTMASGGTFIVMQDLPNDQVYVRHQISTAYEDNNLNTAELSITKNLDSISYFFDDLLSPYIGKYNITPELLVSLRSVINGGISELATNNFGLYGPQVILDGTEIKKLEQDALLKDHVNCDLQLNLPYPFNHLVLKLFV